MRFKRNEAFRFSFGSPVPAFFTIDEWNGKKVETAEGQAKIIDISPNGMKLNTSLDIPISAQNHVKISVRFTLDKTEFTIHGEIIWREEKFDGFFYGIHFSIDEKEQEALIEELKYLAKTVNKNS